MYIYIHIYLFLWYLLTGAVTPIIDKWNEFVQDELSLRTELPLEISDRIDVAFQKRVPIRKEFSTFRTRLGRTPVVGSDFRWLVVVVV